MNISNNNNTTREADTSIPGTSTSDICNDSSSISNDDVCDVNNMLENMSADDNDIIVSICANCGKDGAKNICNKCKVTTYCNAVCKKVHKKKHKKDCDEHVRLATEKHNKELRIAAELHDIDLFKQPPPEEDCPICFLRLPTLDTGRGYQTCCGKMICRGCIHAPVYDDQGNLVDINKQNECPFCRAVAPKSEKEARKRLNKRADMKDARAIYNQGNYYGNRKYGFPEDHTKALELWHQAAELGFAGAYNAIGSAYFLGRGVEQDEEKANYYFERAAMEGDSYARHNLGVYEGRAGNKERALKHWMIAVRDGYANSLETIKQMCTYGHCCPLAIHNRGNYYRDGIYGFPQDFTKALEYWQDAADRSPLRRGAVYPVLGVWNGLSMQGK